MAGYLNQIFDRLNETYFQNQLERPVISVQSTPKAYGHFTLFDAWSVQGEGAKEINIGAGTLDRPIEDVVATLLHEMVHYWNYENGVQDCSRKGTYHNTRFKDAAEARGLIVTRSDKYGWSITKPSDSLVEWCIVNDLPEIRMSRQDEFSFYTGTGNNAANGGTPKPKRKSCSIKYLCPSCGAIVRATKVVRVICADCMEYMQEA